MEIAPATILTISTFDSHLKKWFLIDLAFFFVLDAGCRNGKIDRSVSFPVKNLALDR